MVLSQIIPFLPGYAWFIDANRVYKSCNASQASLFGLNHPNDIVGHTNETLPLFQKDPHIEREWTTYHQQAIALQSPLQFEVLFKTLQEQIVRYQIIPLFDKNQFTGLFGISLQDDNSSLQQVKILKNILDNLPEHVYWKDSEGVYLGCNLTQAQDLNLETNEAIIGKTDYELSPKDKADAFRKIDLKVISEEKEIAAEEVIVKNGESRVVLSKKIPLYDQTNSVMGVLGVSFDITDRKKMEIDLRKAMLAAEAASRAKSEFIANISHDLRTPLTGVVTMSDDLKDRLKGLGGEQEAAWLHESGEQILEFCNNILDSVSADNYTEQDIKEECFDLRQLIPAIGNLEMPMMKSKGLDFVVHVDVNTPAYLITDKSKLYRVLLNLLGNSIKFTEKGHVGIEVKLTQQNKDNVTLSFCVIDTGIGIKPELQDQIFDRFFRANPSYKGTYKGNGLGLYIAQKYVQLLGADRIYVESEEGKGCRFFFTLSFKIGEQKNAVQMVPEQEQRPQQLSQTSSSVSKTPQPIDDSTLSDNAPLLLLIEDNKPALLGLESMVKRAGCRFKSAEDGEKAVELAKTHHFDLIISDIGLPGISGIEATKAIRAWEKENHKEKVPIVALTGHAAQMAEPECLQAGMDKVLTKPATFDQVKNLIQEFISNHEKVESKNAQQETSLPPKTGLGRDLPDTEEELFMLDQYPYFSMKVVTEIYGENCHQLVEESLNSMSELIPKDKEEIKEAFLAKNWDRVEELAHRMKGGAAYAGTVRMKYACQYLERYRKAGHSKSLEKLYYQLIQVVDETKNYIDKWLKMNREV